MTQAETLDAYLSVRDNFLLTNFAAYVVEVVDRFTYEEEENRTSTGWSPRHWRGPGKSDNPDLVVRYYAWLCLLDLYRIPAAAVRVRLVRKADPGGRPVFLS